MRWSELRRDEIDAQSRRMPVILPVGSTEQHGPHLPVGTDSMIVEAIVTRLDAAFDRRLLVLPCQQVGASEHHMGFPGTLTVAHESLRRCVSDTAESVIRHGFRRLVLLNSHGGNRAILTVLGEQIGVQRPDVECLVVTWWIAAYERLKNLREGPVGSAYHACEFETSMMLAVAPQLVDMSVAEDDGIQPLVASMACDMLHGPTATCNRPFDRLAPTGVFGKPSLASAEKGETVLNATAAGLRDLIAGFWPDIAHADGRQSSRTARRRRPARK